MFIGVLAKYLLYKLGVVKAQPHYDGLEPEGMTALGQIFGWRDKVRYCGELNVPLEGACVFPSNHFRLLDPVYLYPAIQKASGGRYHPRMMMRNDFFKSTIFKSPFLDLDEVLWMTGARGISRGRPALKELKPFIDALHTGHSFLFYPGRTRSWSGLMIEYRDAITDEPGSPAFFLAMAQRKRPDIPVAAVPVAGNYNPANKRSLFVFGEAQRIEARADRATQRSLDVAIIESMARCVRVSAPHALAGVLYLKALHGHPTPWCWNGIRNSARRILEELADTVGAPDAFVDFDGQLNTMMKRFAKRGALRWDRKHVHPVPHILLTCPPLTAAYRKDNPVKYLVNQVLHLEEFSKALEEEILGASA